MNYGTTIISLKCNKNFAMNGDSITVSGFIDNSMGKT